MRYTPLHPQWLLGRHKPPTGIAGKCGLVLDIGAARKAVYEEAKARPPARWCGRHTRNWKSVGTAYLNPDKPAETSPEMLPLAA